MFGEIFVGDSVAMAITVVELILAVALALPCGVLFVEVLVAAIGQRRAMASRSSSSMDHARRAILMPAHNEAAVIQSTLETLMPQLQTTDRVIVVADNCTDATATIARTAGATVLERQNKQERGKGYALDFGLRYLRADIPDVVVMVDADCQVQPGTMDEIASMALITKRPVQATYLLESSPNPSPKEMVSTFAFKVKNLVRPLGLRLLGQSCLLTGTGMAFPWTILQDVELASGNIVEDMKLGLDLAVAGHPPIMCPTALVMGEQPMTDSSANTQRSRWENGHLITLRNEVPTLLWQGLKQGRLDLITLTLDLLVPPLSLLVALWMGSTVLVTAITLWLGLTWLPGMILYGAGLALVLSIVFAWSGFARDDLSPLDVLVALPGYILGALNRVRTLVVEGPVGWIRTARGHEGS